MGKIIKSILYGIFPVYIILSITVFCLGFMESGDLYQNSVCNKKITYLGHYTGFGYIVELGCKAGKPMEAK